MPGCPFHGFHWPDRSETLRHVGGDECGLDLDDHGPCVLERDGLPIEYRACPVVESRGNFLGAAKHLIKFELSTGQRASLADWRPVPRLVTRLAAVVQISFQIPRQKIATKPILLS